MELLSRAIGVPLRRTIYDEDRPTFITATKPGAVNQASVPYLIPRCASHAMLCSCPLPGACNLALNEWMKD